MEDFDYKELKIEGSRIFLRPMQNEFFEKSIQLYMDKENTKLMNSFEDKNIEEIKLFMESGETCWRERIYFSFFFAIFDKKSCNIVGNLNASAAMDRELFGLDVGWIISKDFQNRGYATEAAKEMLLWISKNYGTLDYISAVADKENTASINVMKKLGMKKTKEYPRFYADGRISTEVEFTMKKIPNYHNPMKMILFKLENDGHDVNTISREVFNREFDRYFK